MENIAKENFKKWNDALLSQNPDQVAKLYDENATFLPTLSDEFKFGVAEAKQYFEHFVAKNPDGKIVEEKIQSLGPDIYIHSGMYNFEVGPTEKREIVEARFTFLWEKKDAWKIIHHHSSLKPKQ